MNAGLLRKTMIQKIVITIIRSVIAYVILLLFGRLIGRKLLSRITFFDFVVGITLGSLAVRISLGNESSLWLGILSAGVITALVLITDWLTIKNPLFRRIEEGEPVILIQNGLMLNKNMSKERISVSKLTMLLRQKDVFYPEDVACAVIENDGQLSVLLKPEHRPATAGELNLPKIENKLPTDLIVDGKIQLRNLKACGYDTKWLLDQLHALGINGPEQVFYASINKTGGLFYSKYQ